MSKRPPPRRGSADRKAGAQAPRSTKPATGVSGNDRRRRQPLGSLPPPPGPSAQAVAMFEEAMRDLQGHAYHQAAGGFRTLLERYPSERALLDRARVYLELCERELKRQPVAPNTDRGAADCRHRRSEQRRRRQTPNGWLGRSSRKTPGTIWRCICWPSSRPGEGPPTAALAYLEEAVDISPEAGAQARFDGDFESIRDTDTFRRLTEHPANLGQPSHFHDLPTLAPRPRREIIPRCCSSLS